MYAELGKGRDTKNIESRKEKQRLSGQYPAKNGTSQSGSQHCIAQA